MDGFGDEVKDIKPRIRVPAATSRVSDDEYTGMKEFKNYQKPPDNAVMIFHACYQVDVPGKLKSKVALYHDRTHNTFWWSLLNRYSLPINEYRNGPFDFPHQATNDVCKVFDITLNQMERLS